MGGAKARNRPAVAQMYGQRSKANDREGWGMTEPVPVTVRGMTFPSMSACARHFGITPQAVWDAIERGEADNIGKGRNWWRQKQ